MISMIVEWRDELRSSLARAAQQVQDATGSGSASDWADYRYRIGVVTGLRRALAEVEEIYRRLVAEEES